MPTYTFVSMQEIDIRPFELADMFWNMDAEKQADFFDRLAELTEDNTIRRQMQFRFLKESASERAKDVIWDLSEPFWVRKLAKEC